jgi:hypothetical protein
MAARLELYAVSDGKTLYGYDPVAHLAASAAGVPPPRGYVSANDEDEQRLFDLLTEAAIQSSLDARTHGSGRIGRDDLPRLVEELGLLAARAKDDLEQQWSRAMADCVGSIANEGVAVAWRMRYDRGGSVDDGPDEFPTSWSGREGA